MGQKRRNLRTIKRKRKNIKNKNLKSDFFSVYDSKIQEQALLNTKTNFKINSDELNKTIKTKFPGGINDQNYKDCYGTFITAKS